MIITTNGRRSIRVILGLLIAGLAVGNVIVDATAPSSLLRGVAPLDGIAIEDQREIFERRLQSCSSYSKRNCSNAGCVWVGGVCQPASTPPPSPPPIQTTPPTTPPQTKVPTPQPTPNPTTATPTPGPTNPPTGVPTSAAPTSPPTSPPTNNPTIPGMGYCSDKPAVPCLTVDDCTCANNFSAALYERTRHLLVCESITKANVCNNSAGCQWFGGSSGCGVAPTSPPTNLPTPQPTNEATPPPTSNPTPLPTNAPSIPPTKVPTSPPTPSPTSSPVECKCLGLPTPPSSPPTPGPTNAPVTPVPTSPPTTANPTNGNSYGNGPFVTTATSSELVTIPRPQNPGSQPQTNCPHLQAGLKNWHDSATWSSSSIPAAGESVTLPANSKVIINQAVVEQLGLITIPSTSELIFGENAGAAITLSVAGMDVRGALRAGSETCLYGTELTITLHGIRPNDLDIYGKSPTATPTYKGISVNGGIISMHGKRYFPTWSRLAESVPSGQSYVLLQDQVNWEAGQEVLLTTTAVHDSRVWHRNDVLTIDYVVANPIPGVVGSAVHFTSSALYAHIANNGYQAEVGVLSRNIKIQGAADDSEPTDRDETGGCTGYWHAGVNFKPCPWTHKTGFGGHIMVHSGGKGYMEGVELYRMGQTNVLGRYPFHWHLLGNTCSDCFFRANSIHRSFYRCISIHGSHNTTVTENVAYDVDGYCYYLEDGVEEDNTISFNLAAHIHPVSNVVADSGGGQTITPFVQSKDLILPADVTASGFYITNLHNDIIGNAASGGWAGFALPVLHTPIGPNRDINMRPANRLTKIFDGNVAHSTGWWWSHAGAFYSGGSLYYNSGDNTLLEYNAGRDQTKGSRSPCLVDKCIQSNNCGAYCYEGQRAWFKLTNNKVFMTASPSLNSWSGRMEVIRFEAHDVALGLEALEDGFGIDQLLVECRSGEEWVIPGGRPNYVTATGFSWYDTGQGHIITEATFKNCGARNANNAYENTSPTRGCDTNTFNGCSSGSTVWGFLTHSDQFTPEIMQATRGITYEDCGRRFKLDDFNDNNTPSSVSGRAQNWVDVDGSASGMNEPTIIASGLSDAGKWWKVDSDVVHDPDGPLSFIKVNDGPNRGLGHIRLWWKAEIHNTVGLSNSNACTPAHNWMNCATCKNGPKKDSNGNPYCPPLGRIRHIGPKFNLSNDPTGGLPITANAEVAGLVGGYAWLLQLNDGPPKNLKIDQIEVDPIETPLILAIPYESGTSFSITAHAAWCAGECTETFFAVNSVDHVRASRGNTYFYDVNTKLLYVRIIQTPQTYVSDWHVWNFDDPNISGDPRTHALDRFTFSGITLPSFAYGPYLQIAADCLEGGVSGHCATTPSYIEPEICPVGYIQVSYDKCCVSEGSSDCYIPTLPPTTSPTPQPTFGQGDNLVLNGGFELGLTNWYANSGTIQIDSSQSHSGNQSILVTGRTSTWNGPEQDMKLRMSANKTYRISCWAKLKGTKSSDTLKLTLRIQDDVGGTKWLGISKAINNQDWTLVQGDIAVTVTGTLTDIDLYAEGPASGVEFYVDDVSAIQVASGRALTSERAKMQSASGVTVSPLSLLAFVPIFLWYQWN